MKKCAGRKQLAGRKGGAEALSHNLLMNLWLMMSSLPPPMMMQVLLKIFTNLLLLSDECAWEVE